MKVFTLQWQYGFPSGNDLPPINPMLFQLEKRLPGDVVAVRSLAFLFTGATGLWRYFFHQLRISSFAGDAEGIFQSGGTPGVQFNKTFSRIIEPGFADRDFYRPVTVFIPRDTLNENIVFEFINSDIPAFQGITDGLQYTLDFFVDI